MSQNPLTSVSPIPSRPAAAVDHDRGPALSLLEPDPIQVLIADGQPVVRAGFTAMLEREGDMSVAGAAAGVEEAVALASELRPLIALLDLDLPGAGGGLEAARRIQDDPGLVGVSVMILASRDGDDDDDLLAALRAGARAFVLKMADPAELLHAVRVVAGGEAMLSPSAISQLIAAFRSQPQPHLPRSPQLDALTTREREVMALVAAGLRNDQIADRFVISPATVKTHVSRALRKLDAHNRSQLVAIAYQLGLVSPGAQRALRGLPTPALVVHSGR